MTTQYFHRYIGIINDLAAGRRLEAPSAP